MKLPDLLIHACKNISEKNEFVEDCVASKFGFVYLRVDPLQTIK